MAFEYWRDQLNSAQRPVYDALYRSMARGETQIACGVCLPNDIPTCVEAVMNDHPEIYWYGARIGAQQRAGAPSSSSMFGGFGGFGGLFGGRRSQPQQQAEIIAELEKIYNPREIELHDRKFKQVLADLREKAGSLSELEKERAVCDYFIGFTKYEINVRLNQNAASSVVVGRAQCSGFARGVKLLCDTLGIECMVVTGTLQEPGKRPGPHAWNIVRIDGTYYHLDVTNMLGANPSRQKPYNEMFFNYTDSEIRSTHAWTSRIPTCNTPFQRGGQQWGGGQEQERRQDGWSEWGGQQERRQSGWSDWDGGQQQERRQSGWSDWDGGQQERRQSGWSDWDGGQQERRQNDQQWGTPRADQIVSLAQLREKLAESFRARKDKYSFEAKFSFSNTKELTRLVTSAFQGTANGLGIHPTAQFELKGDNLCTLYITY